MRMMRLIKVLGVSFLILILASFIVPPCQAIIEKDFGEFHEIWFGDELFAFKVKVVIETEKDGTWRNNTEYEVFIITSLTYINRTEISYVTFNETGISDSVEITYEPPYYQHLTYAGDRIEIVHRVKSPNATALPFLHPSPNRLDLEPHFLYHFQCKSSELDGWISMEWSPKEPMYIDVTTSDIPTEIISHIDSLESQLIIIRNLMYVLILTTIILVALTGYLAVRKTKKN